MKPEKRFHEHVERSGNIVPTPHMTHLVGHHCPQLIRRQPLGDPFGQQQYWPENAEYARLDPFA
jgi:hypothetical protein